MAAITIPFEPIYVRSERFALVAVGGVAQDGLATVSRRQEVMAGSGGTSREGMDGTRFPGRLMGLCKTTLVLP
jgi:hypothetical protein